MITPEQLLAATELSMGNDDRIMIGEWWNAVRQMTEDQFRRWILLVVVSQSNTVAYNMRQAVEAFRSLGVDAAMVPHA